MDAKEPGGTVQGEAFRSRGHGPVRPLGPAVWAQLGKPGGDDGRTQPPRRPRHHLALGAALRAGMEPPLWPGMGHDQWVVEGRGNVLAGGWQVDLFISRSVYIAQWIRPV